MRAKRFAAAMAGFAATAVMIGSIFSAGAAQASTTVTLVNQTVPGPIGGSQTCFDANCLTLTGVKDLNVNVNVTNVSLGLPLIVPFLVPGCTADINIGLAITSLGLSAGSLNVSISYIPTDYNGNAIGPVVSHTLSIPLGISVPGDTHTITECAALL